MCICEKICYLLRWVCCCCRCWTKPDQTDTRDYAGDHELQVVHNRFPRRTPPLRLVTRRDETTHHGPSWRFVQEGPVPYIIEGNPGGRQYPSNCPARHV